MALKLSTELGSGVAGEYWKVTKTHVDHFAGTTLVELCLYLNEEVRKAAKDPLLVHWEKIEGITLDVLENGKLVQLVYEKIKENESFVGAEDC
jgi:hypothetical protein